MLVLVDLSTAFDTVDCDILMRLLSNIGLHGNVMAWFKTYLQHREFYGYVDEEKSSSAEMKTGLPQGAI